MLFFKIFIGLVVIVIIYKFISTIKKDSSMSDKELRRNKKDRMLSRYDGN